MKIAINAGYSEMPYGGVGRYTIDLIKNLAAIDKNNSYYIFSRIHSCHLSGLPENFFYYTVPAADLRSFHKNFSQSKQYKEINPDILHMLHFAVPKHRGSAGLVITIHDLIYPVLSSLSMLLSRRSPVSCISLEGLLSSFSGRNLARKADALITVSKTSSRDIRQYLGVDARVIYSGLNEDFISPKTPGQISETCSRFGLEAKKYFIYFGGHGRRKNVMNIFQAWNNLPAAVKNYYKFCIAGEGYYEKKIKKLLAGRLRTQAGNFIFTGNIAYADLSVLAAGAYASIYGSFYEGFGFPAAESCAVGVPCICSDIPSLREIMPASGLFVHPAKISEFTEAIIELCGNKNLYNKISSDSSSACSGFSWKKSAELYIEVYKNCRQ
ncbi:MAG: hypothetical protein A2096_03225 [Spirochaetes bacterium GWF1_41_5]|nr:MAG: hypothetical protein A2096_03225 [Spirochaetes bacterium GWF1_41_5]HBE02013.1 hypothetical protein [Spirochaetia bacterium]